MRKERQVSEDDLRDWENSEMVGDDLHCYFSNYKERDWLEISEEARRVYGLMFGDIEKWSAIDGLLSAVAAAAAEGAFAAMSDALGVENVSHFLGEWYEKGDYPPSVGLAGFEKKIQDDLKSWESLNSEKVG